MMNSVLIFIQENLLFTSVLCEKLTFNHLDQLSGRSDITVRHIFIALRKSVVFDGRYTRCHQDSRGVSQPYSLASYVPLYKKFHLISCFLCKEMTFNWITFEFPSNSKMALS